MAPAIVGFSVRSEGIFPATFGGLLCAAIILNQAEWFGLVENANDIEPETSRHLLELTIAMEFQKLVNCLRYLNK